MGKESSDGDDEDGESGESSAASRRGEGEFSSVRELGG